MQNRKRKREVEDKNNQDSDDRYFDVIPYESIKKIFDYLSPKELFDVLLVSKKLKFIAESLPRLTAIQSAFFTQKKSVLNGQLKIVFTNLLNKIRHHLDNSCSFEIETIEEHKNAIEKLIKQGADINSTGVSLFQPLVFHYINTVKAMGRINVIHDQTYSNILKKRLLNLKSLILFLLENKINIHELYRGIRIAVLDNMSALEYANKSKKYPEMAAILKQYDEFNGSYVNKKNG